MKDLPKWASSPGRRATVVHGDMGHVSVTLAWVDPHGAVVSVTRAAKTEDDAFKLALLQAPK